MEQPMEMRSPLDVPPDGVLVEALAPKPVRAVHEGGFWRDEAGNIITIKGWRPIRMADDLGGAPQNAEPSQEQEQPLAALPKPKTKGARGKSGRSSKRKTRSH